MLIQKCCQKGLLKILNKKQERIEEAVSRECPMQTDFKILQTRIREAQKDYINSNKNKWI